MKTLITLALSAAPALAEPPQVIAATATETASGWSIDATLTHPDTGWDHYADAFRIESPDGTILGQRDLAHPHETEQPFTRSLPGVTLPDALTEIRIRAHCLTDGWSEATFALTLP